MRGKQAVAYRAYGAMLFINAFVDLGHKIIVQNTVFKAYDGDIQVILTAIVNALMLLPFILLFSPAGFLSDRFAKPQVMARAAWFAVILTIAITLCYAAGWFWPAFAMTLLMAVQSALYSPAKYGYIKELLGSDGLARGNAMVQAATTIAILTGMFVYSAAFEALLGTAALTDKADVLARMWPLGISLVVLSLIEAWLARRLVSPVGGDSSLRFDWPAYRRGTLLRNNLGGLRQRPVIWWTIIGLSGFWAISQVLVATFPAFAKGELGIDDVRIVQGLLATSIIGIMLGSLLAARLSRHHIDTGIVPLGALGMTIALILTPLLSAPWAHGLNFAIFGLCGGLFIIPLNALMQFHAPLHESGRILAGNNFIQNVVMVLFLAFTVGLSAAGLAAGGLIWCLALVAGVGAVVAVRTYPQTLARLLLALLLGRRYRLQTHGFHHVPASGGALLLGNHISWIDWALVQIAAPRPIRFVLERDIYQLWFLNWFFRIFKVIPISSDRPREALRHVAEALAGGEVVALFPEGTISRNGQLAEFKRGYEMAARRGGAVVIVPFYLHGMWGSRLSRARLRPTQGHRGRRDLVVAFGPPLAATSEAPVVKQAVVQLAARCAALPRLQPPLLRLIHARVRQFGGTPLVAAYSEAAVSRRQAWQWAKRLAAHWRHLPDGAISMDLPQGVEALVVAAATWLSGRTLVIAARDDAPLPVALRITATSAAGHARHWDMDELRRHLVGGSFRPWPLAWPDAQPALLRGDDDGGWHSWSAQELVAEARRLADLLQCDVSSPYLVAAPLTAALGMTALFLSWCEPLQLVVAPARPDVLVLGRAIARGSVRLLFAPESVLASLADEERLHPLHLQTVHHVICPGLLTAALVSRWRQRFGSEIRNGWLHPAWGWLSLNVADQLDTRYWFVQHGHRPGSLGMVIPGVAMIARDGELCRLRFTQAAAQTLPLVDTGGVPAFDESILPSGQCGHLDEDGYLWWRETADGESHVRPTASD